MYTQQSWKQCNNTGHCDSIPRPVICTGSHAGSIRMYKYWEIATNKTLSAVRYFIFLIAGHKSSFPYCSFKNWNHNCSVSECFIVNVVMANYQ